MGIAQSRQKNFHVKHGLRMPREDQLVQCATCGTGFGCLGIKHHCQLCGSWLCVDCVVERKILRHSKPLVRSCQRCVPSRITTDISRDEPKVWARVLSYLDELSVNRTLQSCRLFQISMPLPYQQVCFLIVEGFWISNIFRKCKPQNGCRTA